MATREWLSKEELLAEDLADPEMQALRAKTALARAVAKAVIGYRIKHSLSQRALAAKLGIRQPHVALLERGDRNPSVETLQRLARELGLRVVLDVGPAGSTALPVPGPAPAIEESAIAEGARVSAAAR